MAVVGAHAAGRLLCATPLAELVEQAVAIARLRDPGNQASCPWCGRALDELKGNASSAA
jgi:hypothetical protein